MEKTGLMKRVEAFAARLEREDVNMYGFLLSRGDAMLARASYAPIKEGQPHRMYSVSKTMTALAVGMLADEGSIDLNERITVYFQDWLPEKPDPRLMRLTIRDMLRMATCYRKTTYREYGDENWAKTFFTGTPDHEPGTVFYYDTSCSQVLAALVARISGEQVMEFLDRRLFVPLGCKDRRYWLRDPSGVCQGGSGLCMSLRDMDRTARCLMDGGRGLVPAWFVEEMQKKHIDTPLQTNEEERYGYGWQCWRTRAGWSMYGMGGQLFIMCPEKNTLLSTVADTRLDPFGVQRIYNAFFEEVYPWMDREDMEETVLSLKAAAVADSGAEGRKKTGIYHFPEGNMLGFRSLWMDEGCLYYENGRGQAVLPFGRGICREIQYPGWPQVPALASGGWLNGDQLHIRCHAVGDAPCGFDMLVSFRERTVTVQCRKSDDLLTEGYDGVASGVL